jgi:hypothetical protein
MAHQADIIANVWIFGRYISLSGPHNRYFLSDILIIDGIDVMVFVIMSMLMSQLSTSMASSGGDDDTINDASMANPWPYCR